MQALGAITFISQNAFRANINLAASVMQLPRSRVRAYEDKSGTFRFLRNHFAPESQRHFRGLVEF